MSLSCDLRYPLLSLILSPRAPVLITKPDLFHPLITRDWIQLDGAWKLEIMLVLTVESHQVLTL